MEVTAQDRAGIAERMGAEADMLDAQLMIGVLQRDGIEDTEEVTEEQWLGYIDQAANAREIAMSLWREQLAAGLGHDGEQATEDGLEDWVDNHDQMLLAEAAGGDVAALAKLRGECGLSVFA